MPGPGIGSRGYISSELLSQKFRFHLVPCNIAFCFKYVYLSNIEADQQMVGPDLCVGSYNMLYAGIRWRSLSPGCHLWGNTGLRDRRIHGIYVSQAIWFDYLR